MLWTVTGLLLSLAVLLVVLTGLSGQIWITDAEGIPAAADAVMSAIRSSDWKTLETLVADAQALDPQTGEENSAELLIWDAYRQSLQWTCSDGYELHGAHVTQQVTVTCLDIPALTGRIAEILPEISNTAREQALVTAAEEALAGEIPVNRRDIIMTFVRTDGQWKLLPNSALVALLSGFTAA